MVNNLFLEKMATTTSKQGKHEVSDCNDCSAIWPCCCRVFQRSLCGLCSLEPGWLNSELTACVPGNALKDDDWVRNRVMHMAKNYRHLFRIPWGFKKAIFDKRALVQAWISIFQYKRIRLLSLIMTAFNT